MIALVDGEHYPPTTRWGLATAASLGYRVVACLFLGGTEKVQPGEAVDLGPVPVEVAGDDPGRSLAEAIARHRPDAVLDLSDEPVVGYRERMRLVARALAAGVEYVGADFSFRPPIADAPLPVPTLGVIGTGKRTGKTAIAGDAARVAAEAGMRPVIVAMGRGGPPGPRVVEAGSLGLPELLDMAASGEHAASDFLEDAVTTGLTTIGARRCGGGLAGAPFVSNVTEAARVAAAREPGLVVLEGSGAAMPPVPWDAGILVAPATVPEEYLAGYLGPYRVLLSDLLVLTMGSGPDVGPDVLATLTSHVKRLRADVRVVLTEFQPVPLSDVGGKQVYFATTAPERAGPSLVSHLERRFGCSVSGITHHLSDREALRRDLEAAGRFDVLLTEIKAAGIDVAARWAVDRGAEVAFVDNRAETIAGDGELADLLRDTAGAAIERGAARADGAT
ncbi:MAG: cyclic 2,3-diphosphoglycerate synthetase [Actinomycetota bacterium]|nr:cyclic 2,3-diphosphoglycerate synthetase [Actinomycetota bacterium]